MTIDIQPYYQDDQATLYNGDCLDVMRQMADESVDLVVTSPPYNMGLVPGGNGRGMYRPGANNKGGRFRDGYGVHSDAMPYDEYCQWQSDVLRECWRVARLGIFYNHRPRVEHGVLRMPLDGNYPIPLRQIIIWDRGTGIDVTLRHFCTRQEWIMLFAKSAFALVDHSASGNGDVWGLGVEHERRGHPAPFPLALPMRCLSTTGAASVLDPFAGSGTTLRAAKDLGKKAIGIENNTDYCEITVRRLSQEVLFANTGTSGYEQAGS